MAKSHSDGPKILVVDDDRAVRLLMSTTLEAAAFRIAQAANGAEAIEQCKAFKPDLVLLDINMPEMDGISACSRIRSESHNSTLPIVMVTGASDEYSIDRAFQAGATDFISKPINWPLFHHRVRWFLANRKTSTELAVSYQRINTLERVAPEMALVVGRKGVILEHLGKFSANNKDQSAPIEATSLEEFWPADITKRLCQQIARILKTRETSELDFAFDDGAGRKTFKAQFTLEGRERVLIVFQDTTLAGEKNEEIYRLAYSDLATGLPNQNMFAERAGNCLAEARLKEQGLAFLCISFDELQKTTTGLSGSVSGKILREIGNRLNQCVRASDSVVQVNVVAGAAQVARLSANQFIVLLARIDPYNYASTVADRIFSVFLDSFTPDGLNLKMTPRIGISLFPQDGRDTDALVDAAAMANRDAFIHKEDQSRYYSGMSGINTAAGHDLGDELRHAMNRNQFQLYFQPRVDMENYEVTSVEALLRWHHPLRGFVPLNELLPLAEATGLMVPIGDWVLETALTQFSQWQHDKLPLPRISINLSRQELFRPDLAERLTELLEETEILPDRVELELTGSALVSGERAIMEIARLKDLGVQIVLDDFGTGHFSLASLNQLPLDVLKIDRSIVKCLPGDSTICEVIIAMAQKLGVKVVAEGVETAEQWEFLRMHGCDEMQGFLISAPLPHQELEAFVKALPCQS